MRGKQINNFFDIIVLRITPADAGKTLAVQQHMTFAGDHPRGCGENSIATNPPPVSLGSPPRMRGKQAYRLIACTMDRITPADAGKTFGEW